MNLRAQIMALPENDRLDMALMLIEDLSGQRDEDLRRVCQGFGLSSQEGRFLLALNKRAPHCVDRDAIYAAIYCGRDDVAPSILNVLKSRVAQKTGLTIVTHWGRGFSLSAPVDFGSDDFLERSLETAKRLAQRSAKAVERQRTRLIDVRRWSSADDAELMRMYRCGSQMWAIADELGRSERACIDRIRRLRAREIAA